MDITNIKLNTYESTGLTKASFPSFSFYPRMTYVFFSECFKAARGGYTGADWTRASWRVLKALESVGVNFSIQGMENINASDEPVVFIANHMSTMETLVLPCMIQPRKDVTFVVKESLIHYPFFKHILLSRDPVALGRKNPREDLVTVLKEGVKRLEKGRSIIVFPQSTRSPGVDEKLFNSIGVKLAHRAGVKVVPVALKTDAWQTGSMIKEFGAIKTNLPVKILFGNPMQIKNRGKEEQEEVLNFIKEHIDKWQNPTPQLN